MFRVQADRLDDEVEFVGAVDLARYIVGHTGPNELGFGEVIEPVNPLRIAVQHEEHGIRRVFRPRDQDEVIGAEVEHLRTEGAGTGVPARLGSAVVELAGGLLRPGYHHSAAHGRSRLYDSSAGGWGFLLGFRKLSPPSRKISEFSTKRSAMAVAMVVLKRMLPQSENGVLVVMMDEHFWL